MNDEQQQYYIYLLHFAKPYWTNCQHYIGYTSFTPQERLQKHITGNGSKLVSYAISHGNIPVIAYQETFATKQLARQREIQLKHIKNLPRLCPICKHERSLT